MPERSRVAAPEFISKLKNVLVDLYQHPYPFVPSPPDLKKRASVALILRVNPSYSYWPSTSSGDYSIIQPADKSDGRDGLQSIESFFAQEWVQHGDPEVLFIKRATRKGDKWTGHVALPGGGRDPEDADDQAAAVRETLEEVGIDMNEENAMAIGNLPQRLVTSSWGKIPLMVLCPYVFLIRRHDLPPLRLQPTEVASAHWVPLRVLLSPEARTFEYQDVSHRLANQEWGLKRLYYRLMLGYMVFSAVELTPSSSLSSTEDVTFRLERPRKPTVLESARNWAIEMTGYRGVKEPQLLLWGLTLGVMADFLELLPPHNALELWTYPTFSSPDVRLLIGALSWRFQRRKVNMISTVPATAPASIEVGLDSVPMPSAADEAWAHSHPPGSGESGLGVNHEHVGPSRKRVRRGSRSSRIGFMLEGYYDFIRRGVLLALVGRSTVLLSIVALIWYRFIRRRRK